MDNIPSLDDLLSYGDDYQYPDLIMSDYFKIDKKKNTSQEQNSDEQIEEQLQEQNLEKQTEEQLQEQGSDEQVEEQLQEQNLEKQTEEQLQEQGSDEQVEEQLQEQNLEKQAEEQLQEQGSDEQTEEQSQEWSPKQQSDENDFDDLMNNYDENNNMSHNTNESKGAGSPSDKLDNITTTKIYQVLKKLVSLSYERYEKGTYKYNKKEIVKHYLTNQKFRIIDDLISPTFKPDVYVFDLSPSNNKSLEMYVNAISSVAIKNSLIYLTYNDCILRKLTIKKENAKGIDVGKVANSQIKKYSNFDCTIFNEYRSLYEELREIRDRKIYVFSDFDICSDISKLSQENQEIVWFSTERSNYVSLIFNSLYREYLSSYIGYYVETSGIEDIEKFVREKNKAKYKGRIYNG